MAVEDTRRAIAEAAAQEFLLRGYAGASLSAIAERLGLTKGALSYHFRAKADFATDFIHVVRAATAQAETFAKAAYPTCGASRLVLYFMTMGAWRETEPRYAAGIALFGDNCTPEGEDDAAVGDWLTLCVDALETMRDPGDETPMVENAEALLATVFGAAFFSRHVRLGHPGAKRLRFVQAGLAAAGVQDAGRAVDEVLAEYEGRLPALDYALIDVAR